MTGERENPHKRVTGVRRLAGAMRNSLAGLGAAFRYERSFRLVVALATVSLPLAFWLGRTGVERALLAGSVLLIVIIELVNSAVEATVDRISLENHPLSKRAKDLGSAAAMVSLATAGLVWWVVLAG
jgi:diacylglycerol kinase (ATP)